MNLSLLVFLAFLPFVLLFFLIVIKRWPAIKAMPLAWIITVLICLIFWQISFLFVAASFIKGVFVAIEIMLIIFGAVFFIEVLKEKGQIRNIQSLFSVISDDARIQVIIIAFLFGSLIEGIAGFGTPAALAAPLLVSIGFTPFLAVVLSLISNSTAVSFGAAGTPVLLGLGGLGFGKEIIMEVTKMTALFHGIAGLIIPLSLVFLVVYYHVDNKKIIWRSFFEMLPFSVFAWLSFIVPYLLVAFFIGPELPSIAGGFIGITITGLAAYYKFLVPKNVISFNQQIRSSNSARRRSSSNKKKLKNKFSLFKSSKVLVPYLIIIFLLTLSRTVPVLKNYLTSVSLRWGNILGANMDYSFLPFYTPSFYFLIAVVFCIFIFKANLIEVKKTLKATFSKIKIATIALIFTLALVQLFLISGNNPLGISSMPLILAGFFESILKESFIFVSPFIGAFGSFIAGSNTASNLLFASFQFEAAKSLGVSLIVILSLQVVGGAIGNMIAIHNVLAASATVGIYNEEGRIIRKTIWVMMVYALIVGILGLVAVLLI